jgi:hypothetical protein
MQLATPQQRFMPTPVEAERVWKLAQTVAGTDFVPRTLRGNVPAITAAMLTGREIGIGPMHSLRAIDVIDGKPSLSAELMASLVLRSGHYLWCAESTAETCTMVGRRKDWPDRIPDQSVTWTVEDAKQAGLAGKGNWQKYPRAMLRARATSELCRGVFADVVERVGYVADELEPDRPAPTHVESMETVRDVTPDQADTVDAVFADEDVDDSSTAGDGKAPAVEDQPPAPDAPTVEPAGSGEDPPHVAVPLPSSSPDPSQPNRWDVPDQKPADPFDWRDYAKKAGLNQGQALSAGQKALAPDLQVKGPKSLDDACRDEYLAGLVRDAIDKATA